MATRRKITKWLEPAGLSLIEDWAHRGLTNAQVAHNMGIARTTLYEWMRQSPEMAAAISKGKEVIDREVENALLKRALGFTYEELTETIGADRSVSTKRTVKTVPPDTVAAMFWLQNRKPQVWRDVRRIDLAGQIDTSLKIVIDDGDEKRRAEGQST